MVDLDRSTALAAPPPWVAGAGECVLSISTPAVAMPPLLLKLACGTAGTASMLHVLLILPPVRAHTLPPVGGVRL